jgi:hypothetical protein
MKGGNEFSKNVLSADAQAWISKLHQTMVIKEYGGGSIKSYVAEMTLLF